MTDPYAQFQISRFRSYNPDTGPSYVITYMAPDAQMDVIAAYYELLGAGAPLGYGYKTKVNKTAYGAVLTVEIPDEILFTTRWNFNSSVTQQSIFWFPSVRNSLGSFDITTLAGLKAWLLETNVIKKLVDFVNGNATTLDSPPFPLTQARADIVHAIVRDGFYSDWKRPVLKRCRVIPVGLFSTRVRLNGMPLLYSLDGIYNLFGLINDVYDQAVTVYNDLPAADPKTMWSWKLCEDDSDQVIGSGKVQESRHWIFGRWSTVTNTFVE